MNPVVNGIKKEYRRKFNFVYVEMNTAKGKQEARDEGIMGTPTFLVLDKHGERVYMLQGVYPREVLEQQLDAVLERE